VSTPARPLREAFRENLQPALLLWSGAGLVVALYFLHPASRAALDRLAVFKDRAGLWFVLPVQALLAGLLPWLFQFLRRDRKRPADIRAVHLPWLMFVWAVQGAMIDAFYTLLAHLYGDAPTLRVILLKTATDMLIYTPFISMTFIRICFALKDAGFSPARARRDLGPSWFRTQVLPLYKAALIVWTPTVCLLYSLPLPLQFPVQAIVQCYVAVLVVVLTRPAAPRTSPGVAPA
jgi:hypothetical protein